LRAEGSGNYLRQGQVLYSNNSEVCLTYLADMDVADLPLSLVYLIVLRLAIELSFSFSVEGAVQKNIRELYEIELRKTANLDAKEGSEIFNSDSLFSSSWIESRN